MKFTEKDMEVVGSYPPEQFTADPLPRYNTPITARENYFRMFDKEKKCEWIPAQCDCIRFSPTIIPDCVARGLVSEAQGLEKGQEGGKDMFGLTWVFEPGVGGSMVKAGEYLFDDANDWKEKVVFPNLDEYDWEGCADRNRGIYFDTDRITSYVQYTGMFERLISFMTMQNALIALVDEEQQDAVKELFGKLCDFYDDLIDRLHKHFHIDMVRFHDDWGTQRGPMIHPDTIREMIAPYIKRVVESCHKRGIIFDLHCCGKNEQLVPVMIECGVDQWAGQDINDFEYIYKMYGDRIVLGITPYGCAAGQEIQDADALAKKFVEDYGPDFQRKPFFASIRFATPEYRENLYKYSRMAFGE